ncbi:hypothetical protein GGP41_000966, partial [Bipolaris sorokiniana]
MGPNLQRLVRFKSPSGDRFYGELGTEIETVRDNLMGLEVPVLSSVPATHNFQCVGINYKTHTGETGLSAGGYPVIFTKPPAKNVSDALAGPYDNIPINDACKMMDYEAELCIIIRKDYKNVKDPAEALSCIVGYTFGNVSSRFWQTPQRSGNQHGSAKSFDKLASL